MDRGDDRGVGVIRNAFLWRFIVYSTRQVYCIASLSNSITLLNLRRHDISPISLNIPRSFSFVSLFGTSAFDILYFLGSLRRPMLRLLSGNVLLRIPPPTRQSPSPKLP